MRFLVDECIGPAVARWLTEQDDEAIIQKAHVENWILITGGKDFGEKVYRERRPHKGVVLLRLGDERAANKIRTRRRLVEGYADRRADQYAVATESRTRFART